jgi:hypothetical protein
MARESVLACSKQCNAPLRHTSLEIVAIHYTRSSIGEDKRARRRVQNQITNVLEGIVEQRADGSGSVVARVVEADHTDRSTALVRTAVSKVVGLLVGMRTNTTDQSSRGRGKSTIVGIRRHGVVANQFANSVYRTKSKSVSCTFGWSQRA